MTKKIGSLHLYNIAGPNGAGKTTFARQFLPHYADCKEFVNADLIAGGLSPFSPQTAAFRSGRLMLEQIRVLGRRGCDFGFETTLAGRTYVSMLRTFKEQGYSIHPFFLWLQDVELTLARIADRVRQGGHDVPEHVVRRRFNKGIRNLFRFYLPLLDSWIIFDNSTDAPRIIAFEEGQERHIIDHDLFADVSKEIDVQ